MKDNDDSPERVEQTYEFNIPAGQQPIRIDTFLTHSVEHATRTKVQRAITQGNVLVNGEPTKSNYKLRPHDKIVVRVMRQPPIVLTPENIPIDVVYEDDVLMVINKPPGMAVHPGVGNRSGTLVNAVLWHLGERDDRKVGEEDEDSIDELGSYDDDVLRSSAIRPGIVHRLDKETSGLILVAKNEIVAQQLSVQFANRTVSRTYLAVVWGVVKEDELEIDGNIGRSTKDRKLMAVLPRAGKAARTDVSVVERYECATLVTCKLHTGRTHQIRVHLSHHKHPLIGDIQYGGDEAAIKSIHHLFRRTAKTALQNISRQALHAFELSFQHPVTKETKRFTCPIPDDIVAVVTALRPPEYGEMPPEFSTIA